MVMASSPRVPTSNGGLMATEGESTNMRTRYGVRRKGTDQWVPYDRRPSDNVDLQSESVWLFDSVTELAQSVSMFAEWEIVEVIEETTLDEGWVWVSYPCGYVDADGHPVGYRDGKLWSSIPDAVEAYSGWPENTAREITSLQRVPMTSKKVRRAGRVV